MLDFLIAHWDWLVAAVAGHFGISGVAGIVSWAKAEYAKVSTKASSDTATLNARIAALELAVKGQTAPPPAPAPVVQK